MKWWKWKWNTQAFDPAAPVPHDPLTCNLCRPQNTSTSTTVSNVTFTQGAINPSALTRYYPQEYEDRPDVEEFYLPYPVLGIRAWSMEAVSYYNEGRPRPLPRVALKGNYSYSWKSSYLRATCGKGYGHHDKYPAPPADCSCGVYAYKPGSQEMRTLYGPTGLVVGLVTMSGVIEHDRGYRAREARLIVALLTIASDYATDTFRASFPDVELCRSRESFARAADWRLKNPDRNPWPNGEMP